MCLSLNSFLRPLEFKDGVCETYKFVRRHDDKLYPPFNHNNFSRSYKIGVEFKSNRSTKEMDKTETEEGIIEKGVHVLTRHEDCNINLLLEIAFNHIIPPDDFVLIKLKCLESDFVASGIWSYCLWNTPSAVFTKVTPVEIVNI